jgi:hypothetical protein
MSFPILEQCKIQFPNHSKEIEGFSEYYSKKYKSIVGRLWHELSVGILKFIFSNDVKGKLPFNFYTDFVKKFDRSIDQISHLKIFK